MKIRLVKLWDEIHSNYWFVPALMVISAVLLSFVTISLDEQKQLEVRRELGFVWGGGPEGARGLLSTIASSMITVASLTFSVTIVALSQASIQFGPRILRNFIRDIGNQVVLGTFIATFVYSLLVLRTVRNQDEFEFVPNISITISLLMALASLGVLLYFIHHASVSIYAPFIVAGVAHELMETMERLYPDEVGLSSAEAGVDGEAAKLNLPGDFEHQARPVPAKSSGYLQAVDTRWLMHLANKHDLVLSVMHRPGFFVMAGDDIVKVWPGEKLTYGLERKIRDAFVLGRQRTSHQDVEFAVDQLVEIAVRALSPAINDPFTTMTCIDWLGAALSRLTEKVFPTPYRYDQQGKLRLVFYHPVTFEGVVDAAFNQIRQQAGSHAAVRIRLLEAIQVITERTRDENQRAALQHQAWLIRRGSQEELPEREDIADVIERYKEVVHTQPQRGEKK